MKKTALMILALVLCVSMGGCLGAVQADDYIYVVGIGFDKGSQYRFNITFLVQKDVSESEQASTGGAEIISAEGDTLFDAITVLSAGVPFKINFSRVNTFFFGEEMARSGSIKELANITFNALKIRQSVKLMVCLGTAQRLMQGLCLKDVPNITKLQFSVFHDYTAEGITVITNYARMLESIRGQRSDPVMMLGSVDVSAVKKQRSLEEEMTGAGPKTEENGEKQDEEEQEEYTTDGVRRLGGMSPYIAGTALFDGWYMKGTLSGYDTMFLLLGRGELKKGGLKVQHNEEWAVLYIKDEKPPRVKLTLSGVPRAKVELEMACNIVKYKGAARSDEWDSGLQQTAEQLIANEMARVFNICRELNSDAFGFGEYASTQFSDIVSWEGYDWKSKYPLMEAEFSVKLELADENVTTRLE
ncbi:MAG: Ger(x)C family spore germination C-terminal domain-containing protein [Christensenellales bacterium]